MNRVVSLIMRADSRWQFDDSNYTNLPSATAALVSGQQDYALATSHLTIDRVEILDSGSQNHILYPLDRRDIRDEPLAAASSSRSGAYKASNGTPEEYDLVGNSVLLYPIPNYSLANALVLCFTRGVLEYDYTANSNAGQFSDGTGSGVGSDSPGFNSLFHELVPLWCAYNYWIANKPQKAVGFMNEIQRKEAELDEFYGGRNRDDIPMMTVSTNQNSYSPSGQLGARGGDSNM